MYICKKFNLSNWSVNKEKNFLMTYFRNLSYIICRITVMAGVEESSISLVTIGVNNCFEVESWADWCICLAENLWLLDVANYIRQVYLHCF